MRSDMFLTLGANLIWQTLLVALVVGLALKILPRREARTRYRIAMTGLLGTCILLIAPFLPSFIPDLSVGFSPEISTTPSMQVNSATLSGAATPIAPEIAAPNSKQAISIGLILLAFWVIGSLLAIARLVAAAAQGHFWIQRGERLNVPNNALSKPVRIFKSADINAPLVLGLISPAILVPKTFKFDLDSPETLAVLEHEIAHIDRLDLPVNLIQRLVLAALWWCLPLYWVNKQIMIEREKLCDDIAASRVGTGRALARALVSLAESHSQGRTPLLAIGIHPKAGALAERITRLCQDIYKETHMPTISKKLMLTSSLAVPLVLGGLIIAAPRAIAHSPIMSSSPSHSRMDDISSLQYALFKATALNRADEVREILGMGIDPAFHLHGDGTPLILAAKLGNIEIADLLLNHGAQINRMTASDESALINAVKTKHLDMVKFLVERGADVSLGQLSNPRHRPEWRSPLSTAQKHRHTKIAQYLQASGAVADNRKKATARPINGTIVEGRLSSKFGILRKKQGGKKHTGIDIANAEGTPIYAPADGTIIEVSSNYKDNPKWGHVVVLQTAGGIKTIFAHLQDSQVNIGQTVTQGTQIARLGNTGQSTGPHVHIQTRVKGELKDPLTVWPSLAR